LHLGLVRTVGKAKKRGHTKELAQRRTPPMGANMTPTIKKRGRTLLGVKIGLEKLAQRKDRYIIQSHCHAFNLCWRNAVSKPSVKRRIKGKRTY
jgi:hypothetical protein